MLKLIWLISAATLPGQCDRTENSVKDASIAPARDGNIAIEQELAAAREKGTVEAYDLFLARHPTHPLAKVAREERARLTAVQ